MDNFDQSLGDMPTMGAKSGNILAKIDRYELLSELGRGAFGAVFLAKDLVADTLVAIKTLPPEINHSPDELNAVRENFKLVSKLAHPNIAQLRHLHQVEQSQTFIEGVNISRGDYFVVMEYVEGSTLRNWVTRFRKKKVPFDQVIKVIKQVASALDYAHDEEIIHRDIKPANIMITPKNKIKILDFGLAAEVRSSMSRISMDTGSSSGTRPYMPPEQLMGRRQNHTCDQYALAVMCYEMLCGEVPFQSVFATHDMVLIKDVVCRDEPEVLEEVSPARSQVILKALAKDRLGRYENCNDFAVALHSCDDSRINEANETKQTTQSKEKTQENEASDTDEALYNYDFLVKLSEAEAAQGTEIEVDISQALCHICGGYGSVVLAGMDVACPRCQGSGVLETADDAKVVRIKVPKNFESGSRLRLKGVGLNKQDIYIKLIVEEAKTSEQQTSDGDKVFQSSETEKSNLGEGENDIYSLNLSVPDEVLEYGGSVQISFQENEFSVDIPEKSLAGESILVSHWSKATKQKLRLHLNACAKGESASVESRVKRKVRGVHWGRIYLFFTIVLALIIGVWYKNAMLTDNGFYIKMSLMLIPFLCQWWIKRLWYSILSFIVFVLGVGVVLEDPTRFTKPDYQLAGSLALSLIFLVYTLQVFTYCLQYKAVKK